MQWKGRQQSSNVDDRRGQSPRSGGRGGMRAVGGIGVGGIVIALIVMFMGGDPSAILNNMPTSSPSDMAPAPSGSRRTSAKEEEQKEFGNFIT